jgi:alpha-1,2-mannosyltransferase
LFINVRVVHSIDVSLTWQSQVEFVVNASFPTVLGWLSRASIGLSTMVDEHFGINIIEFMVCLHLLFSWVPGMTIFAKAAGIIPIAHASGGPLRDIIVPFNGKPTGT